MSEASGLSHLLANCLQPEESGGCLSAFELFNRTCTPDLLFSTPYELLARAVHEDFIHQERIAGRYTPPKPTLQNQESLEWDHRQENYQRVDRMQKELAAIGCEITPLVDWEAPSREFTPQEVEEMARMEH